MREWKRFYELTTVKSLNDFNREEDLKNVAEEFYSKFYLNHEFKSYDQNNLKEVLTNPDLEDILNRDLTEAFCKPTLFKDKRLEYAHILGDAGYKPERVEKSNLFLDWLLNRYNIDLTTEISYDYDNEIIPIHLNLVATLHQDDTDPRFNFLASSRIITFEFMVFRTPSETLNPES